VYPQLTVLEFDRKTETLTRDGRPVARVQTSESGEARIVIGTAVFELTRPGGDGWDYRLAREHEPDNGWRYRPTGLRRGGEITGPTGKLELRASLIHSHRWELSGASRATITANEPNGYPLGALREHWHSLTVAAEDIDCSTTDALAALTFGCWLVARYESMQSRGVITS
jgi:hypothetical protein